MRRGDNGVSVISAFSGRNASFTALKIAAGGGIAPPSPTPLMPNSVFGEGVSMCLRRMWGMSVALGSM